MYLRKSYERLGKQQIDDTVLLVKEALWNVLRKWQKNKVKDSTWWA